ncbi:hypothetical protein [Streptomyces sp. Ac-502]|uniref:hypothetical protein n=1 Tax=Streptomyces sp. Ac-502 TaxID=3342801 RepID=UPI00386264CE
MVLPALASANRDETVFEAPERLDLCRRPNQDIVFGRGAHNCIGAHLARTELTWPRRGAGPGGRGRRAWRRCWTASPPRPAKGRSPTWDDESPAKSPLTLAVSW